MDNLTDDQIKMLSRSGPIGQEVRDLVRKVASNLTRTLDIAITTPYTVEEIQDFMVFTGLKSVSDCDRILKRFSECGISNLRDVNILASLGVLSNLNEI